MTLLKLLTYFLFAVPTLCAQTAFVVYKAERQVVVLHDGKEIDSVKICAYSEFFGPKRMQGDRATPEGVYFIDRFNRKSSYHLSLGINYPNQADKIRSKKLGIRNLGGDIFIHGGCASVGCIAVTNPGIEKLFSIALDAKKQGRIPVYIFPSRDPSTCYNLFKIAMNTAAELADKPFMKEDKALFLEQADFYMNLFYIQQEFQMGLIPTGKVDKNGLYVTQVFH